MARAPKGGDTDQIKAVASGECQIALTNTYYLARLMRSTNPRTARWSKRSASCFPNQSSWGTHVNIAGAGVAKNAPNRAAAQQFLEYLASDQAQAYFADGNNEWPAVAAVKTANPALDALGDLQGRNHPDLGDRHEPGQGPADARPGRLQVIHRESPDDSASREYPGVPRIAAPGIFDPGEFDMATLQELLAQKEALEREIELTKKRDRAEAIAKVRALMAEYGLTLADLSAKSPAGAKQGSRGKVAAKYRDQATGDTWSGRGLQPNWLKAALAAGRKIDDFKV